MLLRMLVCLALGLNMLAASGCSKPEPEVPRIKGRTLPPKGGPNADTNPK